MAMSCSPSAVCQTASALLDQCAGFIQALPDQTYSTESRTIRGGTLGKHVRHVVDHFAAAVGAFERGEIIDYDHRERCVPMENDRTSALDAIAELRAQIAALTEAHLNHPVRIRVMLSGDGSETELSSTLGRELFFAAHHAIHHHAMMKAIAAEFGVEADAAFGKAPSTINFESARR
ncbi:MAG: hypothetical protein KF866_00955 [Phycisphaeraceae bacterium]|nr:hypothetical protein [Phycisphaeraceae bacterium]